MIGIGVLGLECLVVKMAITATIAEIKAIATKTPRKTGITIAFIISVVAPE